jgi:outer membrane protein assembly factor BamB
MSVYKNMQLSGSRLYVSDDNDTVWSIDPAQGQVNWKQAHLKDRGITSPASSADGILVGDSLGWLHMLSARDGALIGRTNLGHSILSAPIVRGKQVFVFTQSGHLFALSLERRGPV